MIKKPSYIYLGRADFVEWLNQTHPGERIDCALDWTRTTDYRLDEWFEGIIDMVNESRGEIISIDLFHGMIVYSVER